jgi:4-hydroxybenzoyl-CoA reductase subunit beta
MMPLPPFEVHFPGTVAEAVALHASRAGAMYIAGGTDLLPNLKHRLYDTGDLVSLSRLSLGGVRVDDGAVTIGAGAVLADLVDDPLLQEHVPALCETLALVAGPLHRNRATLGGNVMLDTRCLYYNQTEAWRDALGKCLKREGDWCHVIGSGLRCVAARSNDSAPLLIALGATLHFETPDGPRDVAIRDLYGKDGRFDQHVIVPPSALLVSIRVPAPSRGRRLATYRKVRTRDAIDFPQLGLAVVVHVDDVVLQIAGVLGAILPEPRVLSLDAAVGTRLDDDVIDALAATTAKQARPQTSIHGEKDWRREVAGVEMRRALREIRSRF